MTAYMQAKSANMLTAREMARRAKVKLDVFSVNPGLIYTNLLQPEAVQAYLRILDIVHPDGSPNHEKCDFWKTIPQGAATTVFAAFDPQLSDASGAYLDNCQIADHKVASHTSDPVVAEKLWTLTEEILGEKFTF
ncbi:hypothetical protein FB45DRAFT_1063534 [Roridomyces roridus]|uniref:Short-chain dehydrogenase n=1 Tax=Roridomyces roridus TaxID=1738132 RepID=A0AAD7BDI2_9AGAR|nr:hypothetical protein FB45DRAFT_1063534 [Roridomyces roridus]